MRSRRTLWALVLVFTFALTLVGLSVPSGTKTTRGPYQSALSHLGVTTAEAAKKHCPNTFCEFAHPGFFCDAGGGTKCVFSGGCQTVACP
jgi:hypothetical protein